MRKRGRPKHPDILTPREWEVLGLIREGLTNEQIANRLGISLDGVKFHVSEILGKLGVENRHEAARWSASGGRLWWLAAGAPLLFWRRLRLDWLSPALTGGLVLVVAAGIGLLVWALLATRGDGSATLPVPLALPEGDRLAYVGIDANLWLMEGDEPVQRLTEDGISAAPQWSPDGRWLLFLKDEAKPATPPPIGWEPRYSLWLADTESGEVRQLAGAPVRLSENPWSPESREILYMKTTLGQAASVWVTDLDGDSRELLPADFGASDAAWSSDGRKLAIALTQRPVFSERVEERGPETTQIPRDNGLYLIDAAGGEPQPLALVEAIQRAWDEGIGVAQPQAAQPSSIGVTGINGIQWSPDGGYLAFQPTTLSASLMADGVGLLTVPVEGGPPVYHGIMLRSQALLDWFPDGRTFVFTLGGGRDVYWGKRIAVAQAGVPGARVVAEDPERATREEDGSAAWSARSDSWPVVSPDGSHIVFQASEARRDAMPRLDVGKIEGPKEGIWMAEADGSNPRQLTSDPDHLDFLPRWSADGKLILFVRTDGQPFAGDFEGVGSPRSEIWLVRSDGTEAKPLLTDLLRTGSYYGLFGWEEYLAWHRAP